MMAALCSRNMQLFCNCYNKVVYRRITLILLCNTGLSLKAARMTNTSAIACQNIRVREIHSAAFYVRSTDYERLVMHTVLQ